MPNELIKNTSVSLTTDPYKLLTENEILGDIANSFGLQQDAEQTLANATVTNSKIVSLSVEKLTAGSIKVNEYIQSTGFVTGVTGWQIKGDGTAEFVGITLTGGTLKYGKTSFSDSVNAGYILSSSGIYAGAAADSNYLKYDIGAATLTLKGVITSESGSIGGWTIGTTTLYSGTNIILDSSNKAISINDATFGNKGMQLQYNSGTPRWYAGDGANQFFKHDGTNISFKGNNAELATDGTLTISKVVLTGLQGGSQIDGQYLLANTVGSAAANLALRNWTTDLVFSVTDADTIAWSTGNIILSDGTSYAITAGNTGNMSARTYIYLDIAVSTTALQLTTTASSSVGNGKKLIATAINGTSEATYFVYSGSAQQNLDGAFIATGTLTANEIAANTITGGNIASLSVSGKSCTFDTGTIGGFTMSATTLANSTNIILDASNKSISLNNSTFGNTGVQLQYNSGTPRAHVGTTSNYLQFDGTKVIMTAAAGYSNMVVSGGIIHSAFNLRGDNTSGGSAPVIKQVYSGYSSTTNDYIFIVFDDANSDGRVTRYNRTKANAIFRDIDDIEERTGGTAVVYGGCYDGTYTYMIDAANYAIVRRDKDLTNEGTSNSALAAGDAWGSNAPMTFNGTYYCFYKTSDTSIRRYTFTGSPWDWNYHDTITLSNAITGSLCWNSTNSCWYGFDSGNNLIRKFNSTGTQTATLSVVENVVGVMILEGKLFMAITLVDPISSATTKWVVQCLPFDL